MKPFKNDPFSLMTFHRVLISTAIAGAIFYGIWALVRHRADDHSVSPARATAAVRPAPGMIRSPCRIGGKMGRVS